MHSYIWLENFGNRRSPMRHFLYVTEENVIERQNYMLRNELVDSAAELVAVDDIRVTSVAMDASRQMLLAHAWHNSDL